MQTPNFLTQVALPINSPPLIEKPDRGRIDPDRIGQGLGAAGQGPRSRHAAFAVKSAPINIC